jgi:hypothetical protein
VHERLIDEETSSYSLENRDVAVSSVIATSGSLVRKARRASIGTRELREAQST